MVNTKKLLEMARKWRRMAALGKRRISLARTKSFPKSDASTASVADKGHSIIYSVEGRRFMVPLTFLSRNIFIELLRLSEEAFGFPGDGPITLPCDAAFLENLVYLLKRRDMKDVERALLGSIFNDRCSSSFLFSPKPTISSSWLLKIDILFEVQMYSSYRNFWHPLLV